MGDQGSRLDFKGNNFMRMRLVLSVLSRRPIRISEIRSSSVEPGVKDFEVNVLKLICSLTNGSIVNLGPTGTELFFKPGFLTGGSLDFDCGKDRGIGYYLELLCYLAPFCKKPLNVTLRGVTNCPGDPSVDLIKFGWIPLMRRFYADSEGLDMKIVKRGFMPNGGGEVIFTSPVCRYLRPIQMENAGEVRKVRGIAYSCRVSPTMANRCMETCKASVKRFLSDVYFYSDHRKGESAGKSPGFGVLLSAETTEGVFHVSEVMSNPVGSELGPAVPEQVGREAALSLFSEIYRGGCCDTTSQSLAVLFMALCQKDVSKLVIGPLTEYCAYFLRHLRNFLGITFKIEELRPSLKSSDGAGGPNTGTNSSAASSDLPAKKMDFAQVHSIPAKISYDGPARVETYFDSTRVQEEDGTETATFRGRPLNGMKACVPGGYRLYVMENVSKGDRLQLTVLKEAQELTVWSLDSKPNSAKMLKALKWLDVASEVFGS